MMKRSRVLLGPVLALAAAVLVGCSTAGQAVANRTSSSPTEPSTTSPTETSTTSPTEPSTTSPAGNGFTVTGRALTTDGVAVGGVSGAFQVAGCPNCRAWPASTDKSGAYSISIPAGSYVVVCVAGTITCVAGENGDPVDVESDGVVVDFDLAVDSKGRPPATTPQGGDQTTPVGPDGGSSGPTINGHVRTTYGQPVAGVSVEFKENGSEENVHQASDSSGAYSISAPGWGAGYNATCSIANTDYQCGPRGGDGGPFIIHDQDQGQVVDFVVCATRDYPQCLAA